MRWLLVTAALLLSLPATALTADAYIVVGLDGEVLLEKNADETRSIASITKLIVAEHSIKLDQDELITITREDIKAGHMRTSPLRVDQSYTRRQLTELALVSSDNVAAIALGRSVPENVSSFATIVEPSGLDPQNTSTARRLAQLASELYTTDIASISTHTVTEVGSKRSTNPLLDKAGWTFYLSKTGFINQSGGCLVTITEIAGRVVTVVVLGAKNTKERWLDLIELRRQLGDSSFYVPVKVTRVTHHRRKHKK